MLHLMAMLPTRNTKIRYFKIELTNGSFDYIAGTDIQNALNIHLYKASDIKNWVEK